MQALLSAVLSRSIDLPLATSLLLYLFHLHRLSLLVPKRRQKSRSDKHKAYVKHFHRESSGPYLATAVMVQKENQWNTNNPRLSLPTTVKDKLN